ncbi:hypothetical protein ACIO1C_02125 [Streptomyces sp. NPDC087420]|uniref:hypothetical protein n=1 Tax=Streptomyces sp. NPDC087420 TaxID=3365785 RepID=UPI0038391B7C
MATDPTAVPRRTRLVRRLVREAARLLAAVGLALDSYLHAHLADRYDLVSADISQGTLFRIEAGFAAAAALLILLWRRWPAELFAWSVAAGGLTLLLIYRYADIGAWGPFPDMYEPIWYGDKVFTVVVEAVAVVATSYLLVTSFLMWSKRGRPRGRGRRRAHAAGGRRV